MRKRVPVDPFEVDEIGARGVPLVGGGRPSAVPGSQPENALLKKERRGRLMLDRTPRLARETLSVHYERKGAPHVLRATRESGRFFRGA